MKSLFSVPTARLLCFSSSLCSTLAQINPLPGTGIVLRQKIKTMLKLPLFVTLCGVLLINSLPAVAHPHGSYMPPGLGVSSLISYRLPALRMQKFVDSYIEENDDELAEIRERSARPFMIIDSVMDHYDLPEELRYLAVIESELRAGAVSRVGATGPWQLMAGTARDLGLKVSRRSDERTNYYKSTGAAALYLRDLHREFKDWLLVLAAYNVGPAPVYRAIRLAGSRNFWALERYLPGETRQHVRRFIATAYYFAVSGPVSDPVRTVPGIGVPGVCGAGVPAIHLVPVSPPVQVCSQVAVVPPVQVCLQAPVIPLDPACLRGRSGRYVALNDARVGMGLKVTLVGIVLKVAGSNHGKDLGTPGKGLRREEAFCDAGTPTQDQRAIR
jgi:Transglycosylase SLT domain